MEWVRPPGPCNSSTQHNARMYNGSQQTIGERQCSVVTSGTEEGKYTRNAGILLEILAASF